MQGLSIASASTAAASAGPATGAAVPGGDIAEDAGGSAFGAILAGQIKGKSLVTKSGVEVAFQEKSDADKGKIDGLALDGAAVGITPSDLLALVNAGAVPIQIAPATLAGAGVAQAGGAVTKRGGDQLALMAGGDVAAIAGQLSDVAAIAGQLNGVAAGQLAGLPVGKSVDSTVDADVEGIAGSGKMTRVAGAVGQGGAAAKADQFASMLAGKAADDAGGRAMEGIAGDGKALPAVDPAVGKTALEAFASNEAMPATAKLETIGVVASDPSSLFAMPMTAAVAGGAATGAPVPALEITAPLGSPGWGNALADKVTWMSSQGNQVAELHLNPPHLGPLEVQLTVSNDQASAVFVSHHPAVRDAIEAAMPRLREMLADSGIMLGNTMVGAESFQQQQQQQASAKNSGGGGGAGEMQDEVASGVLGEVVGGMAARAGRGMVDTFV